MNKLLIGALLIATTAVAQVPKTSSTKSTSGATKATSTSATRPARPLPNPSLKEKLESGDNAIPSYKQQKDAGVHRMRNRYAPRRAASGARKDTLNKQ